VFRSLAAKLTLAFLLIGLTGSILVAVITQQRTRSAFNNFIMNREQISLVENLVNYYQVKGSWNGVADALTRVQNYTPLQPGAVRDIFPDGVTMTLVSTDRTVLFSNGGEQVDDKVSRSKLNDAITMQFNGETIGWLLFKPTQRTYTSNTPEGIFLRTVNRATLVSAGVAVLLALLLGGLLAYTMTNSLRELTDATFEIARGHFGKQVKVRTRDEIGELAESFNQMSLKLDQATKARLQMTADIAHDLRSPLSVITGYAEALNDNKLLGTPEIYGILLQETKHLDHLVDDLRLLSLADTGELSLTLQPMSPITLIQRVAARHAVAASQHQLDLQLKTQENLPLVNVDVERMSQVLDNLILNAFRYTPEGGRIELGVASQDDSVEFTVSDTGRGIDAADLPHVFDRFYRGDKSRQHNGESGLGLAIAKSIVEAHSGSISVESQPGQGAKFTISLKPYSALPQ
jgi:two-component system, OmpR family, sensor histidine kinase BaeS